MNEADNEVLETEEPSTAEEQPEQELSIPKHRYDAAAERVRRLEEEVALKDRALNQVLSSQRPQAPVEEDDEVELENLGLTREVTKKVKGIIGKQIGKAEQKFGGVISNLASRVEETQFIQEYGADKKKFLEKMREKRNAMAARGAWLPLEEIFKLVKFDEDMAKPAPKAKAPKEEAKPAAKAEETPKTEAKPKASAAAGKSIEDWENELDEEIKAKGGRI
jgi:hypothetical protein